MGAGLFIAFALVLQEKIRNRFQPPAQVIHLQRKDCREKADIADDKTVAIRHSESTHYERAGANCSDDQREDHALAGRPFIGECVQRPGTVSGLAC